MQLVNWQVLCLTNQDSFDNTKASFALAMQIMEFCARNRRVSVHVLVFQMPIGLETSAIDNLLLVTCFA